MFQPDPRNSTANPVSEILSRIKLPMQEGNQLIQPSLTKVYRPT